MTSSEVGAQWYFLPYYDQRRLGELYSYGKSDIWCHHKGMKTIGQVESTGYPRWKDSNRWGKHRKVTKFEDVESLMFWRGETAPYNGWETTETRRGELYLNSTRIEYKVDNLSSICTGHERSDNLSGYNIRPLAFMVEH